MILQSRINALGRESVLADWYCLECRRTVQHPEEPYCPVCSSRLIPGPRRQATMAEWLVDDASFTRLSGPLGLQDIYNLHAHGVLESARVAADYLCPLCKKVIGLLSQETETCPICESALLNPGSWSRAEPVAWVDGSYVWR